MRVVVLGCLGFIGSKLIDHYLAKSVDLVGCDLAEFNSDEYRYYKVSILSPDFDSIFGNHAFDVCINASGSGNVGFSVSLPFSDFEANTHAVAKVLDTIRKFQPTCKYIHISSAAVYGNPIALPIIETGAMAPLSPYGYHKWMSEILCQEFHRLFKLKVCIVRPFSVYGERLKKQLFWDLCTKLKDNHEITLSGTGMESRDFIHIHDLLRLIDMLIDQGSFSGEAYNAASGREATIREVAECFESYFGETKKISFSGEVRKGDPLNWRADVTKVAGLGFSPTIQLEVGIYDYIRWFEKTSIMS
jgi:UDP-glucose 4-epimerase